MNQQSNPIEIDVNGINENIFSIIDVLPTTNDIIHEENNDEIEDKSISTKKTWCSILNPIVQRVLGFSLFSVITILLGTLIVCYTTPKSTVKKCELNFVQTNPNPIEYNYGPRSVATCDVNNDNWLDIV
ncbi:unnamed protein product, partial [Adineta ricciae]